MSLLAILALAPSAAAQGDSSNPPPPTLESLQAEIEKLKSVQKMQPQIGNSDQTMTLFGRIHLDAWAFPNTSDSVDVFETGDPGQNPSDNVFFRRARIGMKGKAGPNTLYKAAIDFASPENLTFKDLYFGWTDLPVVQELLIGNQKRPYGLDSLNSSNANVFMERPFTVDSVTPDARRLGIQSYGVSKDEDWNWRYAIQNSVDVAQTGTLAGEVEQYEVSGRLANTAWYEDEGRDYGHWAVSAVLANPSDDASRTTARFRTRPEGRSAGRWIDTGAIAGTEAYFFTGLEGVANYGPTQFTAELQGVQVERQSSAGRDLTFWGGYFYVAHFLTGEHIPWKRRSGTIGAAKPKRDAGAGGWGAWQIAARYSFADFSTDDVRGGQGQSVTLGVNWLWNANASLQFNYLYGDISERNETVGSTTYSSGDYQILGIRFRMVF